MKRRWRECAAALGMASVFALLFMASNSPLFRAYGSDSAIFISIGRALAQGVTPYTGIFDHKGPVIFYINALAQVIAPGTGSIWVVELLCLYASLCALRRIAVSLRARPVWLVQLAYLLLFSLRLDGGNYTEEYCNLFILWAFAWMLELLCAETPRWRHALGIGAMFGLCAMTRLNNAMPIGGMVLVALAWMLCARRGAVMRSLVGMAAGVALVVLPFVLYFWLVGALPAFIYSAFEHNLMYTEVPRYTRKELILSTYGLYAVLCTLGAMAGTVLAWRPAREEPDKCALKEQSGVHVFLCANVCAAVMAGVSALLSHKGYPHYLLLCAPAGAIGVGAVLRGLARYPERNQWAAGAVLATGVACMLAFSGYKEISAARQLLANYPHYAEDCLELAANIPPEERGDVLGYRVEPKWYVASGIVPGRRIFFLQEILAQVDPALMEEILAMFAENPPRWLAIPRNLDITPPIDARVKALIDARYERVARNQYNALFRLVH